MNLPPGVTTKGNISEPFRRYSRVLDPMLRKPKSRAYTATILSFLVISLFLWYAIRPTLQTILSLRREIRDNIEVNKQMEQKINNLVEAQAVYQEASKKIPLLPQALPKNPDAVGLLLSLQSLAGAAQASVSAIQLAAIPIVSSSQSTASGKLPADVTGTPIIISLEGNYNSIKSFLNAIFAMRRIVTVLDYSIEKTGDEHVISGDPIVRLILRFNVNYFPGAPYER